MAIESRYKKSIKNNFIGRDNLFEEELNRVFDEVVRSFTFIN